MTIVELLKKSNHYTNHRAYTEKAIKDYIEIAQPLRLKYPNLVFKDLIDSQSERGTEPFDSKEKMIQIERTVIGIIGSKINSRDRIIASKTTFANSINTNITNNPNFSIYNAKIKAENQKIMDMELLEEQRLAEILKEKVRQDEIKRNSIIPEIIPEILPSIVATSSLLPLGIIGLLLYTSMGRK